MKKIRSYKREFNKRDKNRSTGMDATLNMLSDMQIGDHIYSIDVLSACFDLKKLSDTEFAMLQSGVTAKLAGLAKNRFLIKKMHTMSKMISGKRRFCYVRYIKNKKIPNRAFYKNNKKSDTMQPFFDNINNVKESSIEKEVRAVVRKLLGDLVKHI